MEQKILDAINKLTDEFIDFKKRQSDNLCVWLVFISSCGSCFQAQNLNKEMQTTNNKLSIVIQSQARILETLSHTDSILQVRKK